MKILISKAVKGMDREKVMWALENCRENCYTECPYWNGSMTDGSCMIALHDDALSLLKEQEAVEPKKAKYQPPMYTIYEYECEKCKSPMMNKQPFCMGCGRSVKWNA